MPFQISIDPGHDEGGESVDLGIRERTALGDVVPLGDAAAAAGGGGMLGCEHGMTAPWGLASVVPRLRVPYPRTQHLVRVAVDHIPSFGPGVGAVLPIEREFRPERRAGQPLECRYDRSLLTRNDSQ